MGFSLGRYSQNKLITCNDLLQIIVKKAIIISEVDFGIIHGFRDKVLQNSLFRSKASKKRWPDSEHNTQPSNALDFAVWVAALRKYDWEVLENYYYIWGLLHAVAFEVFKKYGQKTGVYYVLRWGGNWDRDADFFDQNFYDLGHIEIVKATQKEIELYG